MNNIDRACSLLADVSSVKNIDATAARQAKSLKRVEYLKRLETFKTVTWFAKPESLSSMHCARHGWTNASADTLRCNCGASIIVRIDDELDLSSVENITKEYQDQLKHSHDSKCFWHGKPLSVDILHGPNAADARALLSGRLNELLSCSHKSTIVLPQYVQPGYSLSRALKEHLDATQQQAVLVTQELQSAFLLALCGWSVASTTQQGATLQCVCCQMKVFLDKTAITHLEIDGTMDEQVPSDAAFADQPTDEVTGTNKRLHANDSEDVTSKRCKTVATSATSPGSIAPATDSPAMPRMLNPAAAHRGHCPYYLTEGTLYDLSPTRSSPLRVTFKSAASVVLHTTPPQLGALASSSDNGNTTSSTSTSLFSIWDSARTMVGSALAMLDASTSPAKADN